MSARARSRSRPAPKRIYEAILGFSRASARVGAVAVDGRSGVFKARTGDLTGAHAEDSARRRDVGSPAQHDDRHPWRGRGNGAGPGGGRISTGMAWSLQRSAAAGAGAAGRERSAAGAGAVPAFEGGVAPPIGRQSGERSDPSGWKPRVDRPGRCAGRPPPLDGLARCVDPTGWGTGRRAAGRILSTGGGARAGGTEAAEQRSSAS